MNTFKAHAKPVYEVAISPDGKSLLTAAGDEQMVLWTLEVNKVFRRWPGSMIWAPVACSPDGKFVARGGYGTCVWRVDVEEEPVIAGGFSSSVAFSPDGAVFAAHGTGGLARWAMPKGKPLPGDWGGTRESTNGQQFPCGGMAISPDGRIVATTFGVHTPGRYVSVVYLWDAHSGNAIGSLPTKIPAEHPTALCFSPDSLLLAGASGAIMRIWGIASQTEIANLRFGGKKFFKGQVFTPDGRSLLTVGQDQMVTRWAMGTWTISESIDCKIGKLNCIALHASPSGPSLLAVGSATGKIAVWEDPN